MAEEKVAGTFERGFKDHLLVGEGWTRPLWKRALIWIRWRPWCWLKGAVYNRTTKIADRLGRDWGPFQRQWWISNEDPWELNQEEDGPGWREADLCRGIKQHDADLDCDCHDEYTGKVHWLLWMVAPDYNWSKDDWYKHEDRMYRLVSPDESPEAV